MKNKEKIKELAKIQRKILEVLYVGSLTKPMFYFETLNKLNEIIQDKQTVWECPDCGLIGLHICSNIKPFKE